MPGKDVNLAVHDVVEELRRATAKHPPMHSAHEGYAVILEEMDELWLEVRIQNPDRQRQRNEAMQVAATAIRFMLDICSDDE